MSRQKTIVAEPVPPSSPLVRQCVNRLCELVLELGRGAALASEARLCGQLDLSRTPLREAIDWLCERGVIEREGRRSCIINLPKKSDYLPVEREDTLSKAEQCERWILDAVAERRLRPGQRFTEVEIAEAAAVTVPCVREVLAQYEARRLFEKDPRRSWRMIRFTPQTIGELWEIRRLIEHHVLTRLCTDYTPQQHDLLKDLLQKHKKFAAGKHWSIVTFRELDKQFHQLLSIACENRFINDMRFMIDLLIHVQLADDAIGREGMSLGVEQHMAILEAILAGDLEKAQAALSTHLNSSEYIMNQALSRDQDMKANQV